MRRGQTHGRYTIAQKWYTTRRPATSYILDHSMTGHDVERGSHMRACCRKWPSEHIGVHSISRMIRTQLGQSIVDDAGDISPRGAVHASAGMLVSASYVLMFSHFHIDTGAKSRACAQSERHTRNIGTF